MLIKDDCLLSALSTIRLILGILPQGDMQVAENINSIHLV